MIKDRSTRPTPKFSFPEFFDNCYWCAFRQLEYYFRCGSVMEFMSHLLDWTTFFVLMKISKKFAACDRFH